MDYLGECAGIPLVAADKKDLLLVYVDDEHKNCNDNDGGGQKIPPGHVYTRQSLTKNYDDGYRMPHFTPATMLIQKNGIPFVNGDV